MMTTTISSPHLTQGDRIGSTMRWVIYCTAPGMALQMAFFGWGVAIQVWTCVFFCVASEATCLILRGRDPRRELFDFSAVLTGILLGLCLPPLAPWWCAVGGSFFAIAIAKQLYGGLGLNPFNPAMVGYVVLLIAFPVPMTAWTPPVALQLNAPGFFDSLSVVMTGSTFDGLSLQQIRSGIDGFTLATPLDTLKTDLSNGMMASESFSQRTIYGSFAGYGWEWINAGFLLGGGMLLWRKVIHWRIPLATLSGLFISAMIFYVWNPDGFASPTFHIFSGAAMLSAFFIATDPVTASTTPKGRLIYGAGIGLLVYVIRTFGGYPDAFGFAILLMNIAVPFIDQYTVPRPYGHSASKKSS